MRRASEQVENEWSATDSTSCNDIPCVIHPLLGMDFILGKLSTNGKIVFASSSYPNRFRLVG
jgi:hypothetical protein